MSSVLEKAYEDLLSTKGGLSTPNTKALYRSCFSNQKKFIKDKAKKKCLLTPRRAGKSYMDGIILIRAALQYPGSSVLYVGLTRESAKRIMVKDILTPLNRKFKLKMEYNKVDQTFTLPNGSIIYLMGCDSDELEREKLLGQKYSLAIIDEGGSFTINLRELVEATIAPALADYGGTLVMTGTPSNIHSGLFYDVTTGKEVGWSNHTWTTFENPHMKKEWKKALEAIQKTPGIENSATYQQHYLGKWAIDRDKLVWHFDKEKNTYLDLPRFPSGRWHHVLGVDIGYRVPSAFVLVCWHDLDPHLYVRDATAQDHLDVTQVAQRIKAYQSTYDIETVVIDNSNGQVIEEMRRRHGLFMKPADRSKGKTDYMEMVDADFLAGRILIKESHCVPLLEEISKLVWDEKERVKQTHKDCSDHCTDCLLYAWKWSRNYMAKPEALLARPGTAEWRKESEEKIWRGVEKRDRVLCGYR